MSGTKPPPESQKNDLGALTKTLMEVVRGYGKTTEFFVNQNTSNELSDPKAKPPQFLTEPHRAINACGGAAVSCLGNGWEQNGFPTVFDVDEDVAGEGEKCFVNLLVGKNGKKIPWEDWPRFGRVVLSVTKQLFRGPYFMHYAYTSNVHRELTTQMIKNASPEGIKWGNEGEEMSNVMILNSGSEACDAMIKLVWQYWNGKLKDDKGKKAPAQEKRVNFISRTSSYHGNTVAALSLSHFPARQANFDGLLRTDIFHKVSRYYPYRDMRPSESEEDYDDRLVQELVDKIEELGSQTVAAFVIETVPGAALGCQGSSLGYLRKIKKVCRHYGILLVYDEIMCGLGRTGYANAWHWDDMEFRKEGVKEDYIYQSRKKTALKTVKNLAPDITLIGKTLGAGVMPAAGLMVNKKVVDKIKEASKSLNEFSHGHTYQAHGGACAAALEVQKQLPGLLKNIRDRGKQLEEGLRLVADRKYIGDIRGRGLFWGVEFVKEKGPGKSASPAAHRLLPSTPKPFAAATAISSAFANYCRVPKPAESDVVGLDIYPGAWTETEDASGQVTNGDHVIFAPAYDSTSEDIEEILKLFKKGLELFDWLNYN